MVIALTGLVAGMVHVLAGPDHLAAVAPLAAGSGASRWKPGFTWGIGHTSGVLLVGAVALAVRGMLPIDAISSWSERLVGVALIGVGVWGGWRALATRVHAHTHAHDGSTHSHLHIHASTAVRGGAHDRGPPRARPHPRVVRVRDPARSRRQLPHPRDRPGAGGP